MRALALMGAAAVLGLPNTLHAQGNLEVRLNLSYGRNLTPPSAQQLEYDLVNGDSKTLNQYLRHDNASPGASIMVLAPAPRDLPWASSIGVELGVQKLFSSVFDPGNAGTGGILEDRQIDAESAMHLNAFVEMKHGDSPLSFQIGAGVHEVRWTYEAIFHGTYVNEDHKDSGLELSPGMFGAVGLRIPLSATLSLPVQFRVDAIDRYGVMIIPSIAAGFSLGK